MRRSALAEFAIGFQSPFRGFALILSNQRIRRWAGVPFVIGLLVFALGLSFAISFLSGILPALSLEISSQVLVWLGLITEGFFASLISWAVLIMIWPVALVAVLFLLLLITRLLAAPFIALLAECTLSELGTLPNQAVSLSSWLRANAGLLVVSLFLALGLASLGFLLLVLSLIPGLGFFTFFGFLLIASFEVSDASFEALQMKLRERYAFFFEHLAAFFGMAFALGLVFLIPGLNFLLFPVFVVGASDTVSRLLERSSRLKTERS